MSISPESEESHINLDTPVAVEAPIALTPVSHLESLETFLGHDRTVAILGGGNMGRLIAKQLIEAGLSMDKMRISVKGSDPSFAKVAKDGLAQRTSTSNLEVLKDCKIVFICVRAQDIEELRDLPFPYDGLVVVITTGISLLALERITGVKNIIRAQTCGHSLIEAHKGIVACCPRDDDVISDTFRAMGYLVMKPIADEMQVHLFSCLVCCPAARVCLKRKGLEMDEVTLRRFVVDNTSGHMECLQDYFDWVMRESEIVLYKDTMQEDFDSYVRGMFTRGGLTEAMCLTILGEFPSEESSQKVRKSDNIFYVALANAFERCMRLVKENDHKLGIVDLPSDPAAPAHPDL